jgi:CRISPR-associated endonuclease/helicase Cas3
MALERIFSHPTSRDYPKGKPLIVHTDSVSKIALLKYKGPEKYRKYLRLISVFHDFGKLNPNFQDHIFEKPAKGFKNHAYLSAVTGLLLILKNKEILFAEYDKGMIALCIMLIAKHHGHLIDITPDRMTENLSNDELERVADFFLSEKNVAQHYIANVNDFIQYYSEFNLQHNLEYSDFNKDYILLVGKYLKKLLKETPDVKKLEYYIITQYIFSCLIEGDKRDASDNDKFLLQSELSEFNSEYFSNKLKSYYSKFKKTEHELTEQQQDLNKVRSEIKEVCVKNVKNFLSQGKKVFQIISPTGSGKTLTFLSVAAEIKKFNRNMDLKIIYAMPFLSITDQVTKECENIFDDKKKLIYRIDSAGDNVKEIEVMEDTAREETDYDMQEDIELSVKDFSENIFDHAFIITTFVKLFETLTSNRNKTLLRFNNFSNSIIIIDEIQSLPPRTYTFLIAFISKFAELFNCYLIIGSATVPHFDFSDDKSVFTYRDDGNLINFKEILKGYEPPINLLNNYKNTYANKSFRRYSIKFDKNISSVEELSEKLLNSDKSNLVILNTKRSSMELYSILNNRVNNVYLLNTNQTLNDRRMKLEEIIAKLKNGDQVYLVSTQLIEAGIDISFPIVYRDLAPFPSLIQSAGRCNRSREIKMGETIVTMLKNENGDYYYKQVYKDLMDITRNIVDNFENHVSENELFRFQNNFFCKVKDNLAFGEFHLIKSDTDSKSYRMPIAIKNFEFDKLGQFKLIDKGNPLEEISLFVAMNNKDVKDWTDYKSKYNQTIRSTNRFEKIIELKNFRRNLSDRIISLNLNNFRRCPEIFALFKSREIFGLSYLEVGVDIGVSYSAEMGLIINNFKSGEFIS